MFSRLAKWLSSGMGQEPPSSYNPTLHYNCFVESLPSHLREAFYQELRNKGHIKPSHRLPDGRLQLIVSTNLRVCFDVLRTIGAGEPHAYKASKAQVIKLMMSNPDLQLSFITKPGELSHVETHRLSELVLDSEAVLAKGVALHKKHDYRRAVDCYDEAIRIEPLDFRAWNNKIVALSQDGQHEQAIGVADEILGVHPDVAILWLTKACVLIDTGRLLEAGECLSRAKSLDEKIMGNFKIDKEIDPWFQDVLKEARQTGKDPDTDVDFWFGKFAEYTESEDGKKAFMCLQMAARIGPDWYVMSISEGSILIPAGLPVADMRSVETLRDFYLKVEREVGTVATDK